MKVGKIIFSLVIMALLAILGQACIFAEARPKARGVVLMIGDGMGINQVRSAAIYAKEALGRDLAMDSIISRGIATTGSADSEVTDSAAASTALYSGHKANSRSINFSPDGKELSGIGHAAKKAGLSVGVVSTTRLTHATPAAVYSRSRNRNKENYIAAQLADFAPEVAMGGGRRHFLPQGASKSKRQDDGDIIRDMADRGYEYVTDRAGLLEAKSKNVAKLLGLFSSSHMSYELDRLNDKKLAEQPSLAEMTHVALSVLGRNPKGFFVMIEGGRIDHACHTHDIKASIVDTLAFDDAVAVAVDYQNRHPDVLVIVTADHETGGLGLGDKIEYAMDIKALEPIKHSAEYLHFKIRADSANAEELVRNAGFDLNEEELKFLTQCPLTGRASCAPELRRYGPEIDRYFFSWAQYALGSIASERSKVGWTGFVHTAQPVPTMAVGPGEEDFRGVLDNTDIAKRMAALLGLTLGQRQDAIAR